MSAAPIALTGESLSFADLAAIARESRPVAIAPEAAARMAASRAVVERYVDENRPAYGLTTGLGPRVGHRLSREEMADFSRLTVLGRAVALGEPLPESVVRAAMAVRLNGLLAGGAGASPALAEALTAMLNAAVHPVVPSSGSVGASDLCLMAHIGLALIGEGEVTHEGARRPAAEGLAAAGLEPLTLAPKDGLAVCSASSVSAGRAALALHDAAALLDLAQASAAMTFEGFRANLTPFDPRVAAARPQPGQAWAAAGLLKLLEGSLLLEPGNARRLQDPISLRSTAPVHGSLHEAIAFARPAVEAEINGRADNPLVLPDDDEIISTGNFLTPLLALTLDTLTQAVAQVAAISLGRATKLLLEPLSGLPGALTKHGKGRSGYAPLLKTAEALVSEIRHLSQPVPAETRWVGDGVEDELTNAPLAAAKAADALEKLRLVLAIELAVATEAVDLAAPEQLGRGPAIIHAAVREVVPPLDEDRALSADVTRLNETLLSNGALLARLAG